jgi:ABC-2 type transport system permease protein
MYEAMMVEEVSAGNINIILTRPISFYEYYLSQLIGYKVITTVVSLLVPLLFSAVYKLPLHYDRLPMAFCLVFLYLFFLHNLSFIVSSMAFFITKVKSFTLVKNLILWLLAGELLPIDLMSPALSKILLWLPFSASVYIPVSYITGRCDETLVIQGFISIIISFAITSVIARLLWTKGLREYTGTGA